ncbi:MAG TPA: hypothetical protein PLB89_04810 [Flavobacteriales bacterium]|nr:hypothetical protein [Flavobacteriales bacterium]
MAILDGTIQLAFPTHTDMVSANPTLLAGQLIIVQDGVITGTDNIARYRVKVGTGAAYNSTLFADLGQHVGLRIDQRSTFSNAAYACTGVERYLAQIGTLSASRTVTLPAANAVQAGHEIIVADESGTVTTTNTIVVDRAGSDTINGATSVTISAAHGWRRFVSDGTSKWTFDAGVLRAANNLSDVTSAAVARANLGIDKVTTFSNANTTAVATDKVVAQIGTMSASRTVTLPAANAVTAGFELVVADFSGSVTTTNTLVVTRAGSDTINGTTTATISAAYGFRRFISDGTSKWTFDAGVLRAANNLSDVASPTTARANLGIEVPVTISGGGTLTNQPSALGLFPTTNGTACTKMDLTDFSEIMMVAQVCVGSASPNTPKVILRYYTASSATPGDFLDIGTSEVSCSMVTANTIATSWIPLAAGAKAPVFIRVLMSGGDATADPVVGNVIFYLR